MGSSVGLVISTGHRGWAIGELAQNLNRGIVSSKIIEFPQSRRHIRRISGWLYLPRCEKYVFMHHALAISAWRKGWIHLNSDFGIRFTHESIDISQDLELFKNARFITVENSKSKVDLASFGIDVNRIHVLPHPIEPHLFARRNHYKSRDVIFVSSFYERKNPKLLLEVIQSNPNLNFTILGKGWEDWSRFNELISLRNLKYEDFNYQTYPEILGNHKVFCSLSHIEGGPVPLLESLAAGLRVVVTDTGHVRDVLKTPLSYNILRIGASAGEVSSKLSQAITDTASKQISVTEYSFENYLQKLESLLSGIES